MKRIFLGIILLLALLAVLYWKWQRGDLADAETSEVTATDAKTTDVFQGAINVRVYDGLTDAPLSDATVVIAESGEKYPAARDGSTGTIRVSAPRDTRFDDIQKKQWGEVTLLVYCDGYIPFVLLYTMVPIDGERNGPCIYLFPDDGSMDGMTFTVIESPNEDWAKTLVEKFRPS